MFSLVLIALSASTAAADLPLLPDAKAFAEEASAWLLEGEDLPYDYRVRLMRMAPQSRLQALVFLRRAGLLTGDEWSLQDVLRPAPAMPGEGE
ncbi:hypothetical protein [Paracoccus sp. (in: a-proteobacteria)]|uniref:hypothetical protein n=1 Tax=Paracoccus sp. TaxID=267 RepID=UPI004059A635